MLHGLLRRLTTRDLLAPTHVAVIEEFTLDLVRDHDASGPQVSGMRLEADVRAFFAALSPDDEPAAGTERG